MSALPKRGPELDELLAAVVDGMFIKTNGEPVADNVADEMLARLVNQTLRRNLAVRRTRGLGGWHARGFAGGNRKLLEELQRHVAEGSMVDVLRVAGMLYARAHLYGMDA